MVAHTQHCSCCPTAKSRIRSRNLQEKPNRCRVSVRNELKRFENASHLQWKTSQCRKNVDSRHYHAGLPSLGSLLSLRWAFLRAPRLLLVWWRWNLGHNPPQSWTIGQCTSSCSYQLNTAKLPGADLLLIHSSNTSRMPWGYQLWPWSSFRNSCRLWKPHIVTEHKQVHVFQVTFAGHK